LSLPEPEVPKRVSEVTPSEVFEMFREGCSPEEVVIQTDADPVKIRDWYRAWLDMRGDWGKEKSKDLDRAARERLAELKELLGRKAVKLQGRKPSGLIATMYYMLAKEGGFYVSQAELAEYYRVSEMVIRENRKLLEQLMKEKGLKLTTNSFVAVSERTESIG